VAIVLGVYSSPRTMSASSAMADAFLDQYRKRVPHDEVRTFNVFNRAIPEFSGVHADAKFAPVFKQERTPEQTAAWDDVLAEIAYFDEADKIVMAVPMWNYGIPWRLKMYFDTIVQPGVTFGYDFQTMLHFGKLCNRPVQLLLTRSSTMPGDFNDFQLSYLRYILGCIGLRDVRAVVAWKTTKPDAPERAAYVEEQCLQARTAAESF
jgi:FMN-dependent NADH-azoreductase